MGKTNTSSAIVVKDLVKDYGRFRAVKGVSFEVGQGQIVGFLGPNGAGKSTVMKVLTCFMSATRGTVQVAGHDVYKEPLAVRREGDDMHSLVVRGRIVDEPGKLHRGVPFEDLPDA